MSEDNVEIVRRCLDAFNRGDIGSTLDAMDPEIEWVGEERGSSRATYHGHDGVRELVSLLEDAFAEIRLEPDEFRATTDAVVVLGRICVRGRGSGAVVESRRAWVLTLCDGKIVRQQTYDEQQEALEATGLRG
jgi:ketosteroid isomerase-like protein